MADLMGNFGQKLVTPRFMRGFCCALLAAGLASCMITPQPIDGTERAARISADLSYFYTDQAPVEGAIGFSVAVARGLKYNLDRRLKVMESALANQALSSARLDLLPEIVTNAGYSVRSNVRGSRSESVTSSGEETLEFSTSQDKASRTRDVQLRWNMLDFGLSYFRAKRAADEYLITEERRQKVAQNMIMDIRDAFWRAVAAQKVMPAVDQMIARTKAALDRSDAVIKTGKGDPLQELKYQQALVGNLKVLTHVRRDLAQAKSELAALINLPPGSHYDVVADESAMKPPRLRADMGAVHDYALQHRPELREEDYRRRITQVEVKETYLKLAPLPRIEFGGFYDSNSFLFNPHWGNFSLAMTSQLLNLVKGPAKIKQAKTNVHVADLRRMALSMAVMTQVQLSMERYALARDVFLVEGRGYAIDNRIAKLVEQQVVALAASDAEGLSAASNRAVSMVRYYEAYADVQNAYGRILNSLGAYRFPHDFSGSSLANLQRALEVQLDGWVLPVNDQSQLVIDSSGV